MTFYAENESGIAFAFDWTALYEKVAEKVLELEDCPYETEVNLLVTEMDTIHQMNLDTRQIDNPTDVLSFPNLDFNTPSDFSRAEEEFADCFNPDTGELILGEIILCGRKVMDQAKEYGHSIEREFAFLIAHSVLHLCGYDHLTKEEEEIMFKKQEAVLSGLGIGRE